MDDDQNVVQADDDTPVATDEVSAAKTDAKADAGTEDEAKTETDEGTEGEQPDSDDDADDDPQPRRRSGLQRLKERNARLEAELAEFRSRAPRDSEQMAAAVQQEVGQPPREQDFPDYLAYERAMTAYTVKQTLAEERVRDRMTQQQIMEAQAVHELIEAHRDREIETRKAIPDYDQVIKSSQVRVAPHVERLVLESDKSALLAHHLATRPRLADELNALPPVMAARRIGRLEERLSLPKPRTETKAPPPVQAVKGTVTPASPDRDLDAWLDRQYGKGRR